MYKKKNLAKSTLAAQLLIGGTSLTCATGEGTKFPDTGATNVFVGVIWGANFASPYADATHEFVTAYRSSGDVFTIVRAQESTSAKQWEIGDNFMLTVSAAAFLEMEALFDTPNATEDTDPVDTHIFSIFVSSVLKKLSFLNLKVAIGKFLNPIGTIREFNVSTNPATLLGFGTWSAYGTGRVTVAIDAGQTEFDVLGETGGSKTVTLTSSESGTTSHGHIQNAHGHTTNANYPRINDGTTYGHTVGGNWNFTNVGNQIDSATATNQNATAASASSAHNNLQPYIIVYRWVRTA